MTIAYDPMISDLLARISKLEKELARLRTVEIPTPTVDTNVALSTYSARTIGTTYQAATDGYVVARIQANSDADCGYLRGYAGTSSPPGTVRNGASVYYNSGAGIYLDWNGFCMPVKSGWYYRVVLTTRAGGLASAMYWVAQSA